MTLVDKKAVYGIINIGFFRQCVQVLLAIVLLVSSIQHLRNPYIFLNSISNYELLPLWTSVLVASLLPFIQIAIAICFLLRTFEFGAAFWSVILFGIFTTVQMIAWSQGLEIDCGCFGVSSNNISATSIGNVLLLLFLSAGVLYSQSNRFCLVGNNQ